MIVLSFILVLNNMEDSSLQPLGMGKLIQAIFDLIFGSERSLRGADVVGGCVGGWVRGSPLCSTALLKGS